VSGDAVFLTSSMDDGGRRILHCLDRETGATRWRREIEDRNPERTSALAGHAAATPAADGVRVVAVFGNAGVLCTDVSGEVLWRTPLGEFDSELGLASSPILHDGRVLLVCDHDGKSFLAALDLATGRILWRTERPDLFRSWSTPIVVSGQLIVSAQDEGTRCGPTIRRRGGRSGRFPARAAGWRPRRCRAAV
jgi:outer membrane protein assembly factor BamB